MAITAYRTVMLQRNKMLVPIFHEKMMSGPTSLKEVIDVVRQHYPNIPLVKLEFRPPPVEHGESEGFIVVPRMDTDFIEEDDGSVYTVIGDHITVTEVRRIARRHSLCKKDLSNVTLMYNMGKLEIFIKKGKEEEISVAVL